MMVNKGGCPNNQPGIGDISYVKNLITEEITSKDFSCSVFGAYSHPSARIGWVRKTRHTASYFFQYTRRNFEEYFAPFCV